MNRKLLFIGVCVCILIGAVCIVLSLLPKDSTVDYVEYTTESQNTSTIIEDDVGHEDAVESLVDINVDIVDIERIDSDIIEILKSKLLDICKENNISNDTLCFDTTDGNTYIFYTLSDNTEIRITVE